MEESAGKIASTADGATVGLKFDCEYLTDALIAELSPLLFNHWREISFFHDIPLDPDWALYRKCQDARSFMVYTARIAGELVGYAAYWVKEHPHYRQSLQATQDVIYIDPARRGFGASFISWCDERLRQLGIQAVRHHVKILHDWGKVLLRQGYQEEERIFVKRLD